MKKTTRVNPFHIHMSIQQCINFLHTEGFATGAEHHAITMRIRKWDKQKKYTEFISPALIKKRLIKYGKSEFGPYLRFKRECAGLSREELALVLKIPYSTIHKWETCLRNISSEGRLNTIIEFFEDRHFIEITKHIKMGD